MDNLTGMKKHIEFKFEKFSSSHKDRGTIVQLIMHEIYVIVIFETTIAIFKRR